MTALNRTPEEEHWIDYTENLLLALDKEVFPKEEHRLVNTPDINGHITYQDEHTVYLFNDEEYLLGLRNILRSSNVSKDMEFYEVQKSAITFSVAALRVRAWEIYKVPHRKLESVRRDSRIPWDIKRILTTNRTLKQYDRLCQGDCAKTRDGKIALQNLDLTIMGELGSHWYRHALPISWIKPLILT